MPKNKQTPTPFSNSLLQKLNFSEGSNQAEKGQEHGSWQEKLQIKSMDYKYEPLFLEHGINTDNQHYKNQIIFELDIETVCLEGIVKLNLYVKNLYSQQTEPLTPLFTSKLKFKVEHLSSSDQNLIEQLHSEHYDDVREVTSIRLSQYYLQNEILRLSATNKLFFKNSQDQLQPLTVDENKIFQFKPSIGCETNENWRLWAYFFEAVNEYGELVSDSQVRQDLWDVACALPCELFIANGTLFYCDNITYAPVANALLRAGPVIIPKSELSDVMFYLSQQLGFLNCDLPENVTLHQTLQQPMPTLYLKTLPDGLTTANSESHVSGILSFKYKHQDFPADCHQNSPSPQTLTVNQQWDIDNKNIAIELQLRDKKQENQYLRYLEQFEGIVFNDHAQSFYFKTPNLLENLYRLIEKNWGVWAENLKIKILDDFFINLTSKIDWFEASLEVPKSQQVLSPWQLIMMLKKKSLFIILDDGSIGLLPEKWYQQLLELSRFGCVTDKDWQVPFAAATHFNNLSDQDDQIINKDEPFKKFCETFSAFDGIQPKAAPHTFKATLRNYQQFALGWLNFLRSMKLGGCIADDMGLGKTVQVLAFLEQLRLEKQGITNPKPTLIVSPKTVVHHWLEEATRFAPELKVFTLSSNRLKQLSIIQSAYDLLLISYGTVRSNIDLLEHFEFDSIILDEAQVIKNPVSQTSQAIKRLRAKYRLALTGTPIENHLGDLISLFNFLNPGLVSENLTMLDLEDSKNQIRSFVNSIKPLILRRLKSVVLTELPEKDIQIVKLSLSDHQRSLYHATHEYYLNQLEQQKLKNNTVEARLTFLEGILRLRQICCDTHLIEKENDHVKTSSKLEYIVSKAKTLVESGHKALFFSQFSQFLHIIRQSFEEKGFRYAYLDGATQNRSEVVNHFKNSPDTHFFLISLKAGGFGLNLTEADYCFLLDPWWNPAVEQQAIDRIHRIGQEKNVFVYKLICENTIEEKIIELQNSKAKQTEVLDDLHQQDLEDLSMNDLENLFG